MNEELITEKTMEDGSIRRNIDLRMLNKGESIKLKRIGEPAEYESEYGKSYLFQFSTEEGTEVGGFVREHQKSQGFGFGVSLKDALLKATPDVEITRLKVSTRAKLKGSDKYDLWGVKSLNEDTVPTDSTSLVLTTKEKEIAEDAGLLGKPFEQIKTVFLENGTNEERARIIYEKYLKVN